MANKQFKSEKCYLCGDGYSTQITSDILLQLGKTMPFCTLCCEQYVHLLRFIKYRPDQAKILFALLQSELEDK
jgi:hypothetical protein